MAASPQTRRTSGERAGRGWAVALLLVGILCGAMVVDAHRRRAAVEHTEPRALVRATGEGDLFLSSGSRWLRHPHTTEPTAAAADAPDGLDVDPAGMAVAGYDGASGGHWLIVVSGTP